MERAMQPAQMLAGLLLCAAAAITGCASRPPTPGATQLERATASSTDDIAAQVERARQQMRRGAFDAVLADLEAILARDPANPMALGYLVTAQAARGEPKAALPALDAVLATEINPRLQILRARALGSSGDLEDALEELDDVLSVNPRQLEAHIVRITLLAGQGNEIGIRSSVDMLRSIMPPGERAEASSFAGLELMRAGRRELARRYYSEALQLDPSPGNYSRRAMVTDDKEDVLADIGKVLELAPQTPGFQAMSAQTLLERKWYREAIAVLDAHEAEHDLDFQAVGLRGIAYWQLGDRDAAARDFARATDAATAREFNSLCWDKAAFDTALDMALAECDAAIAEQPDCWQCIDSRAFVLLRMGRFAESIQTYDKAMRDQWQPPSAYGRGIARLRSGDLAGGQRDITNALAASRNVAEPYDRAGIQP